MGARGLPDPCPKDKGVPVSVSQQVGLGRMGPATPGTELVSGSGSRVVAYSSPHTRGSQSRRVVLMVLATQVTHTAALPWPHTPTGSCCSRRAHCPWRHFFLKGSMS